jgi:hypothetical protein
MDADGEMLEVAAGRAKACTVRASLGDVRWRKLRAEELPADLGRSTSDKQWGPRTRYFLSEVPSGCALIG